MPGWCVIDSNNGIYALNNSALQKLRSNYRVVLHLVTRAENGGEYKVLDSSGNIIREARIKAMLGEPEPFPLFYQ